MTIPGGFTSGDTLGAADMNDLPAGISGGGVAKATAAQNGITAETDLTSLTVTWTAVATRVYEISFHVSAINAGTYSATNEYAVKVTDSSNVLSFRDQVVGIPAASAGNSGDWTFKGVGYETGLSGSTTRKLRAVGATALNFQHDESPGVLIVKDIGPA